MILMPQIFDVIANENAHYKCNALEFFIADTDEDNENRYMTNNNQFGVFYFFILDESRAEATFCYTFNNISKLQGETLSPPFMVQNLSWYVSNQIIIVYGCRGWIVMWFIGLVSLTFLGRPLRIYEMNFTLCVLLV